MTNDPKDAPIDRARATEIARRTIAAAEDGPELALMEEKTVEREFGWVFFYTTKKFLRTKDPNHVKPGNAPLVVERADGRTEYLGTSIPPPVAVDLYEKGWRERHAAR